MPNTIKIAVIQMDAAPASTTERLVRAGRLVSQSAKAGAHLVVLPELFNTGYVYAEANYRLAEPSDGPTPTWMKKTAAHLHIHLAGSIMLLDQDEVYNALLLYAPDGRMWRYDKNYPWCWERGYFRDSQRITVAQTDLGAIGMLICWDVAHPDLWQRYAGRVDLMVISSCPPDGSNPTYLFPNGDQVTVDKLGPLLAGLKGTGPVVFGETINQQTACLGVPAVNTVGCGRITTDIPNGLVSLLSLLPLAPWLVKYLPQANHLQMTCEFVAGCKVVDATGRVLTELAQAQGETLTIAEVTLPDDRPLPKGAQPVIPIHPLAYFFSDVLVPRLTSPIYRQGLRRRWGQRMAPVQVSTRRWFVLLALSIVVGLLAGIVLGLRKR